MTIKQAMKFFLDRNIYHLRYTIHESSHENTRKFSYSVNYLGKNRFFVARSSDKDDFFYREALIAEDIIFNWDLDCTNTIADYLVIDLESCYLHLSRDIGLNLI